MSESTSLVNQAPTAVFYVMDSNDNAGLYRVIEDGESRMTEGGEVILDE